MSEIAKYGATDSASIEARADGARRATRRPASPRGRAAGIFALFCGFSIMSAGAPPAQYQVTLDELIASARAANPAYRAAAFKEQAAALRPKEVGTLDPPQLGLEFFQSPIRSFPNPLKDQMEIDYSLQQMIPFPGKLSAMAKAEQAGHEMTAAARIGTERTIVSDLKKDFAELYFLWRRQEVLAQDAAILRSLEAVSSGQYRVGMAGQADVLRAQTELASLQADSVGVFQDIAAMAAMVNARAGRPVETPIAAVAEFVPDSLEPSYDELCTLAARHRPDLAAMTAELKMREAEVAAQQREFLPDFMARGTYKQMLQAEDDWAIMVGLTLPTSWAYPKFSAQYEQRRLAARQARAELMNMRNMAFAEIRGLQGKLSGLWTRMSILHERVIPAAQRTYETSLAEYRFGKTEFPMLIDAQRMYLMNVMEYHMTVMNYLQARAGLEQALGADLDGSGAEPEGKE